LSAIYARKISAIESARRQEEVEASRVANVTIRLESWESTGRLVADKPFAEQHRVVIRNGGPAVAYDINFTVDDANNPFMRAADHSLPLPELSPGEEWHGRALLVVDMGPPDGTLSWRDGRGTQQRHRSLTQQELPT